LFYLEMTAWMHRSPSLARVTRVFLWRSELRRLSPDLSIRVLSRDDGRYYYKPNLSKAFV